jgi:hypothetical protein
MKENNDINVNVRISYIELANEHIHDLLSDATESVLHKHAHALMSSLLSRV